jgi:elongation factor P
MAALANDLRKGMAIRYNGNAAIVLDVQHRTPGNLRAFVQALIRYINTGKSADVRFASTEKVETVETHRQVLEFSYNDHQGYHFMDPDSYETVTFSEDFVGDAKDYLTENMKVEVLSIEGKPAQLELPATVEVEVVESPEGLKGDSATNVTKPATLASGKIIQVPLFIKAGETIKVDTRTGGYLGRA